jgi:hypothetical protein
VSAITKDYQVQSPHQNHCCPVEAVFQKKPALGCQLVTTANISMQLGARTFLLAAVAGDLAEVRSHHERDVTPAAVCEFDPVR